jgi:hypothetical protein
MKVYISYDSQEYADDSIQKLSDKYMYNMLMKWRYKVMWYLRSIEKEIDEEGGIIIVDADKSGFHTKGFTVGLTERIKELLSLMPDD